MSPPLEHSQKLGTLTVQPKSDLADVLERVLDTGVAVVGDIAVMVHGQELLTLKLRLLVASVDTAERIGIDWWRHDPWFSSGATSKKNSRKERLRHRRRKRSSVLPAVGVTGELTSPTSADRRATRP